MQDPFETLGLPADFDLDLGEAEKRHRDLSRALHPDRFAQSTPAERRAALGKAIEVNEAWRSVRDPVRRGEALLRKMGIQVDEGQEPKPNPELLMEMMEKREELSRAGRQHDAERLGALVVEMKAREAKATAALAAEFRLAGANGGPRAHAQALLRGLGELRYYRRFLDEALVLEDEIS